MTTNRIPPARWAVRVAHLIPLLVLPSGLWRIAVVLGVPVGFSPDGPMGSGAVTTGDAVYMIGLTVVAEATALMSIGLVRPWGEVAPRWIPGLGGRPVRPLAAVVTAYTGAGLVGLIVVWGTLAPLLGLGTDMLTGQGTAILVACYLPLWGWPPLLVLLTREYHRRRTSASAEDEWIRAATGRVAA
ncbi:hypothetical protein LX16_0306 [Stackebrandtia albiflava]|uniref:Uncharacterized protein n=1 Tax=Stackebrandtia albiflava TaxID=406432 RepID=A0A562V9U6_9ACTN|nr:hypothetical protein [Stackebrandtia albiflava]TWJ14621.1 hypothetical protein LX16_0306 [Stackebrandtia albiflava]